MCLCVSLYLTVPYPPTEYRIARDTVQPCWILWIGMKSICIEGTGMKLLKPGSLGVERSRLMGLEMSVSIWN